jgi:plastocyanin
MATRSRQSTRRTLRVSAAAVVVGGAVVGVGVAGAAQQAADQTITANNTNQFQNADVSIETGDTVTWSFTAGTHNAQSDNEVAADPNWTGFATPIPSTGTHEYTFTQPGTYEYVCVVHAPEMRGTITVTGEPTEPTPTPTTTPPPAPTTQPSPTPTPGPSGSTPAPPAGASGATPAPGSAARDSIAPAVSGLRVAAIRRGARITLTLSETSTVTFRFKRRSSGRVVRTARLQVRAGKRTLIVRGGGLKRGRYVVELQARDSGGNVGALKRASVRIGKARR